MIIAMDFDDTFTADPRTWAAVIQVLKAGGHQVILVTGRPGSKTNTDLVKQTVGDLFDDLVFAGHQWKQDVAAKAGYPVDIWIDDHPQSIAWQDPDLNKM